MNQVPNCWLAYGPRLYPSAQPVPLGWSVHDPPMDHLWANSPALLPASRSIYHHSLSTHNEHLAQSTGSRPWAIIGALCKAIVNLAVIWIVWPWCLHDGDHKLNLYEMDRDSVSGVDFFVAFKLSDGMGLDQLIIAITAADAMTRVPWLPSSQGHHHYSGIDYARLTCASSLAVNLKTALRISLLMDYVFTFLKRQGVNIYFIYIAIYIYSGGFFFSLSTKWHWRWRSVAFSGLNDIDTSLNVISAHSWHNLYGL